MESRIGADIVRMLLENLQGKTLEYAYLDGDEEGTYLGLVFTDGETEYHLTVQEDGFVQLASGPEEGETLDEVMSFPLGEVEEPFSTESIGEA